MNPSTGSFISMDSYTGSIYDPASLHRYTYVKDNPVMYKDPSGYIPDSLAETNVALGIMEVLNHVVELNCIGILNSIINATAATLMGSTEDEMLKALFSGYIVGFGMTGLAYFVGAIYALSFAQIMLAEMAAGEAASFVMMVVSALDGDSSSVVQYEIMNMLYFMSGMFMYCGSLPKNDMTPSKNGWNAGSQGKINPATLKNQNELSSDYFDSLTYNGTINSGGRSGGNIPKTSIPNSYYITDNGHVIIYGENGNRVMDISASRIKIQIYNVNPNNPAQGSWSSRKLKDSSGNIEKTLQWILNYFGIK